MSKKQLAGWFLFTACLLFSLTHYLYAQSGFSENTSSTSSAQTVYKQVSKSIFTIYGVKTEGDDRGIALGSAVAIDKNVLATNCHVALAGNFLIVYINDKPRLGRLYFYDQHNDLCLIEIPGAEFFPVEIRPSKTVGIGEEVFAIGNPEGFEKTISRGIISNKVTLKNGTEILQTDAAISPGSSGGGLFDKNSNLIGITFMKDEAEGAGNIGFAIPTELILDIVQNPETPAPDSQHQELTQQNPLNSTQATSPSQSEPKSISPTEPTKPPQVSNKSINNGITRIGYYGKSEIGLMKRNGKCFIAITGRYKPDQPASLAIWFPETPNGLFIFSKIIKADNAIEFMDTMNETKNTQHEPSKSYIFFNNQLYNLTIILIKKVKYPVYIFSAKNNLTENFVRLDYFLGQFYNYNQPGMTTIKFDLDGFTEALAAYNKFCDKTE